MKFLVKPEERKERNAVAMNRDIGQLTFEDLEASRSDRSRGHAIDRLVGMVTDDFFTADTHASADIQGLLRYLLHKLRTDIALSETDIRKAYSVFCFSRFGDIAAERMTFVQKGPETDNRYVDAHEAWHRKHEFCETLIFISAPHAARDVLSLEKEGDGAFRTCNLARMEKLALAVSDAAHDLQYVVSTEQYHDAKPGILFQSGEKWTTKTELSLSVVKKIIEAAQSRSLELYRLSEVTPRFYQLDSKNVLLRGDQLSYQYADFRMPKTQSGPEKQAAPAAQPFRLGEMRARLKALSAMSDDQALAEIGSENARPNAGKLLQEIDSEVPYLKKL